MKNQFFSLSTVLVATLFCVATILSSTVDARRLGGGGMRGGGLGGHGLGGGGGFSRGGPAAGGGFSQRTAVQRPVRQPTLERKPGLGSQDGQFGDGGRRDRPDNPREDRQDHRDDAREDRQAHRDDAREDRQDFVEDEWDDHHHYGEYAGAALLTGVAIGAAAASTNYVTTLPCDTTVFVDGTTYYHCDLDWYVRGSEGGEVVYMPVSAPSGY